MVIFHTKHYASKVGMINCTNKNCYMNYGSKRKLNNKARIMEAPEIPQINLPHIICLGNIPALQCTCLGNKMIITDESGCI